MLSAALERIKELETELREKDVAYNAMKAQRDRAREERDAWEGRCLKEGMRVVDLRSSIEDALGWIDFDTKSCAREVEFRDSIDYLEKILKEYLK